MTLKEFQSRGGKKRAEKLTPAQRKEQARTAAQARWGEQKKKEKA